MGSMRWVMVGSVAAVLGVAAAHAQPYPHRPAKPAAAPSSPGSAPAPDRRAFLGLVLRFGEVRYTAGGGGGTTGFTFRVGAFIPHHHVAVLVRASSAFHDQLHATTGEIGVAIRMWDPSYRFFVEPNLSAASYSPPEDDEQRHAGTGIGVALGFELVHGRHASLDLVAGATRDFLRDFDDEEHVWVALGGSVF